MTQKIPFQHYDENRPTPKFEVDEEIVRPWYDDECYGDGEDPHKMVNGTVLFRYWSNFDNGWQYVIEYEFDTGVEDETALRKKGYNLPGFIELLEDDNLGANS